MRKHDAPEIERHRLVSRERSWLPGRRLLRGPDPTIRREGGYAAERVKPGTWFGCPDVA